MQHFLSRTARPPASILATALATLIVSMAACQSTEPSPARASEPAAARDAPLVPSTQESPEMTSPYQRVRQPAVAGSWYSNRASELAPEIDAYLGERQSSCKALPLALISPHAGYRFSGPTAGKVYAQVAGCAVRRVWVLAPNHRVRLDAVGLYDVDAFRTPLGDLPLDRPTVDKLARNKGFTWLERGDSGEHSLEIQLPFLIRALGSFELVPLLVGELSPARAREIAEIIRPELGAGDLLVVSTDFTHYGARFNYVPFEGDLPKQLAELDHGAWEHIARPAPQALGDWFQRTGATICGRNALLLLTALLPESARGKEIEYTTSGALTGDWENSVSYLGARMDGPAWKGRGPQSGGARLVSPETADLLLELARNSLRTWLQTGKKLQVDESTLPADARTVLGAFVTLQKSGQLRGCIGEITPNRPVWQAVVERAVDAAIHDPRFPPVTAAELDAIHVDISLLGPSWKVAGSESIILGRHGIVLSYGMRRATFLPQVAPEQGWDRATTIAHLAMKAGISQASLPQATYEVYEAQVVGL